MGLHVYTIARFYSFTWLVNMHNLCTCQHKQHPHDELTTSVLRRDVNTASAKSHDPVTQLKALSHRIRHGTARHRTAPDPAPYGTVRAVPDPA